MTDEPGDLNIHGDVHGNVTVAGGSVTIQQTGPGRGGRSDDDLLRAYREAVVTAYERRVAGGGVPRFRGGR